MEQFFAIILVIIFIAHKIVGAITEAKKKSERRIPPEEEPESPYSVPPSTIEGPGPRRVPRPRTAGPQAQRQRPVPGQVLTPPRRPAPAEGPRRPTIRLVRRPEEVRKPPPQRLPAATAPVVEPPKARPSLRRRRPISRPDLQMADDTLINGIIWAEILGSPRCFSKQSSIAARW